jgi:hypothetical protein
MNFLKISCFFIVFVLVSCIPIDIKNEQRFSEVISIVIENKDIKNSFSTFSLDIKPEGACGFASYTVNFDKQPAHTPPFEAKLISWSKIDTSTFRYMPEIIDSAYKDTLLSISETLNLDHFMFITVTQKVFENDIYSYKLLCHVDSVITMYLNTRLDSQGIDTIVINKSSVTAFNILPFLKDQIRQGNDSLIQFNLQYAAKTDSIGDPVYASYKNNPIKLLVKK